MANTNNATEKDRQIIRQSMSKLALQYFENCRVCPTMADIVKITTMLEDYTINGYSKDMVSKMEKLDEYIQETYFKKN